MTNKTIPTLAAEAASFLTRGKRKAEGIGNVLVPRHGAPDWLRDLCHAAHDDGGMLPDDWRYEFIGDALDCIAGLDDDTGDDDALDAFRQSIDGSYIYTAQQTAWLGSRAGRYSYCDEAAEEFGGELGGITDRIVLGMMREAEEVFASVWRSLSNLAEADAE